MNIFISWSGDRSHRVAKLLKTWIRDIIQASKPWISSTDISSGSVWFTEIINKLGETTQGIICLTKDNKDKPWILFEAGALAASGLNSTRVYTLLIDVNQEDIKPPLALFNLTSPDEASMYKLIVDINSTLPATLKLEQDTLNRGFNVHWPHFYAEFNKLITETAALTPAKVARTDKEILSEILDTVRGLDKRIRTLEERHPQERFKEQISTITLDEFIDLSNPVMTNQPQASQMLGQVPVAVYIIGLLQRGFSDEAVLDRVINQYPTFTKKEITEKIKAVKVDRDIN